MGKDINRRLFLKSSAVVGAAGLVATGAAANVLSDEQRETESFPVFELAFNGNGKYKILQLTDTHYVAGDSRSKRALNNVNQMLDAEKPDLVVHTGDVIYGKPAEQSLLEILSPISERKIPFAVALGNHDGEFGKSRKEVADIICKIPYNINKNVKGVYGDTNCTLALKSSSGSEVKWVFYLFDTNHKSPIDGISGYDYIHFDQVAWYRSQSKAFTENNGGKPVPSMAFFHIPLIEHKVAVSSDGVFLRGTRAERVCCPRLNSGLFISMKEMGDVKAVVVGHDHDSDYGLHWNGVSFIFGRFSGCDTVYNHLKPNGARVIELTEGEDGFRSWIRLYGGRIIQDFRYPDDFVKKG